MVEELNLEHFALGTFVDYVHALKQERDALRAQLTSQGGEVGWREHSVNYAKGEKCPETIETLQAAWDRDQELINDMRHEIARHKARINRLEQRRPADQVADGVVVPIKLLKIIEQSWRIPNGCPKSVSEEVGEIIGNGLAELRALLANSEEVKP